MKIFKKVALLTVALATASVGLIGCKSNVKLPVTFVAVTSNTYDDEVTFGDYDYKFKGKVDQKSNKFILEAKVQQRHLNAGGGQGQGGWGNWGGGGNNSAEEEVDPSQVVHVTGITITEKQSNPGGGGGGMPPFGKKLVESSNDGPDGDMPGAPDGDMPGGPGGDFNPGGPSQPQEQKIVTELTLEAGKDKELQANITPDNATNKKVNWSSSNPAVATVSDGKITAVDRGTAVITATSDDNANIKADVTVTVTKVDVAGLTLDPTSETLFINQTKEIKATISPDNASIKDVEWSSSDEEIATVSGGKITGVAEGTATITAKSKNNPAVSASLDVTVLVEDLRQYDYKLVGTYTVDAYGYTITFENDGNAKEGEKTVIHADFNKTEGRHEFYYNVVINEQKQLVKFQAKDPTFKNSIAKDYKTWDERDSDYIFRAKATGNNNSVATAYLYMHKDGSAVLNAPSGTERKLTIGLEWKFENDVFTVKNGEAVSTSKASKNPDRPGYMIVVGGYTFFLSKNPEFKWKKYEAVDFLGVSKHEFKAEIGINAGTPDAKNITVNLYLLTDGTAFLYNGDTQLAEGTYTDQGGAITINMTYLYDGEVKNLNSSSVTVGDVTTIDVKFGLSQQRGPNLSWSEIEATLTKTK